MDIGYWIIDKYRRARAEFFNYPLFQKGFLIPNCR